MLDNRTYEHKSVEAVVMIGLGLLLFSMLMALGLSAIWLVAVVF